MQVWEAWYAIYGYDSGREAALGPFPTRKAAERAGAEGFNRVPRGYSVRVDYKCPNDMQKVRSVREISAR